ncbi:hypothetical protein D3C78_1799780 [compost metagenome]
MEFNTWEATPFDDRFQATLADGSLARNAEYTLWRNDGSQVTGRTDSEGFLTMQKDMRMDGVYIEWKGDKK